MNEKLLQSIWQFGYFKNTGLQTTGGEELQIIFPGSLNTNQGPDFSNARIRIGSTTFFGSVELHIYTSDWDKHHHGVDEQYNNVILHVVYHHNQDLNHAIPVLELQPLISNLLLQKYLALMQAATFIPCSAAIQDVSEIVWLSWKERLLVERLSTKASNILNFLHQSNNHWEETFWWVLARQFGTKLNGDAFEAVARSISVTVLAKHKNSLHSLEALLLGQANLLSGHFDDAYPVMLQREYAFLKVKLQLQPSPMRLVFLRMRPSNFPTIRLAQLAALVQQSSHLFSKILEEEDLTTLRQLFNVTANDYWHYHYHFKETSVFKPKTLGRDMTDHILINAVVPAVFAYGLHHRQPKLKEKAVRWLQQLSTESNHIIKGFKGLGINSTSAFDSQALLQLKNEYCTPKKCLQCAVGNHLLKKENVATNATVKLVQ